MDSNTALVLALSVPLTGAFIASAFVAKYQAQVQKSRRNRSHIHPIALIYRQIQGLDLKDEAELEVEDLKKEMDELRRQLNALRDTTTQYDLSIDHHLRDLDLRVDTVERINRRYSSPATEQAEQPLRSSD